MQPGPEHRILARTVAIGFGATVVAAMACGGNSEPTEIERPPASIDVRPSQAINITVGDSILIGVHVEDASGQPTTLGSSERRWRVSAADVVRVHPSGLAVAQAGGEAWIALDVDNEPRDSVFVRVMQVTGSFKIRLIYASDVPQLWRDALESAARRWEETVRGELPAATFANIVDGCASIPDEEPPPSLSGVERGVSVYVVQSRHFPVGTYTEAVAGPCLQRPLPTPTTIFGYVSLNRDKPVALIPSNRLRYVAVHELGHVLGLVGGVQGQRQPWFDLPSGRYTGAMAIEGWRRVTGFAPAELFSRSGAHWDPMPIPDVMSSGGRLDAISLVTIGALMDLGYPVRWSGAGQY